MKIMSANLVLNLPEFIRSVKVNSHKQFHIFLGAGASISSGVPSVDQCIWRLKQEIFLSEHTDIPASQLNLNIKSNRIKIQSWLDSMGYPPQGSEDEYSFYIEKCYPLHEDRKSFFFNIIHGATPGYGYRLLPLLAQDKLLQYVWTTNFDTLVAKGCENSSTHAVEIGIDCQDRILRWSDSRELTCVYLHGDYRYDKLKNTVSELRQTENQLLDNFIAKSSDCSLIVSGYSGRDKSIRDCIIKAYSKKSPFSVFWCGYGIEDFNDTVKEILDSIRNAGGNAFYIPTKGFDDLICRLSSQCLSEPFTSQANKLLADFNENKPRNENFTLSIDSATDIIKANAVQLECPQQCWSFELEKCPQQKLWAFCREKTAEVPVSVIPFKGKFYALGDWSIVKKQFEEFGIEKLQTEAIDSSELKFQNGSISHLFSSAILKSFAYMHGLTTDAKRLLWENKRYKPQDQWGNLRTNYPCYKQLEVAIEYLNQKLFIVMTPTVRINGHDGKDLPIDIRKIEQNKVLGWQHNNVFNNDLEYWRRKLFGNGKQCTISLPGALEHKFAILNKAKPLYTQLAVPCRPPLPQKQIPSCDFHGTVIEECNLVFNGNNGFERCPHPIRGLTQYLPYAFPLTSSLNKEGIKIGVIAAEKDIIPFNNFLMRAETRESAPSKEEYLLDFPGFHNAFKIPLLMPDIGSSGWEIINESTNPKELANDICRAADRLKMIGADVVIIYLPKRWGYPIRIENDVEYFDLHDFVKASCAQKGIVTQFIAERTTPITNQQCRIWWWLSLAIYAKAGYTPWILDGLDRQTAYVGLGYSIDQRQRKGEQIILGCSHIYNAQGEGLSFRLNQLEDAWIERRTGNPFMSKEDARRVGESIIQLFFEQRNKMPDRVVIHKRTPFRKEEVEGLCCAMHSVKNLELVEVSRENNLKFISSSFDFNKNKFNNYGYPVERGTLLLVEPQLAYFWIHGRSSALGRRIYYQGKRRIPAPVRIKRHYGCGDLHQLAIEILGLSKMDFNRMDLYGQMPCTIQTANKIAQIGVLLQRYKNTTFDYRLFM